MVSSVEGKIIFRAERFVIVESGGIGYRIFTTSDAIHTLAKNQKIIKFWTHLYLREDTVELYGFLEYSELEFFEILIQISGIGPKSALGVLAVAPLDTLKKAISSGETSYLTKVSGIGRKIAEKIILELKDKMGKIGSAEEGIFLREEGDVLKALRSLGYSLEEAREALKKLPSEIEGAEKRVKEALKILGQLSS